MDAGHLLYSLAPTPPPLLVILLFLSFSLSLSPSKKQRESPEANDGLPLIAGAQGGVESLARFIPIVAYLTVRPSNVSANTRKWLSENGFPPAPVVSKPTEVPFASGNQWKADALHSLWPHVVGIVDDNPKLPTCAGSSYRGAIYLFGHEETKPEFEWALPCPTWPEVVEAVRSQSRVTSVVPPDSFGSSLPEPLPE
jgi:hypothetical protein